MKNYDCFFSRKVVVAIMILNSTFSTPIIIGGALRTPGTAC